METFEILITTTKENEEQIKAQLGDFSNEILITEQNNLDGNIPEILLFFIAGLDVVLKVLEIILKSDELRNKIQKVSIDDKKLSEFTREDIKKLIDYYNRSKA